MFRNKTISSRGQKFEITPMVEPPRLPWTRVVTAKEGVPFLISVVAFAVFFRSIPPRISQAVLCMELCTVGLITYIVLAQTLNHAQPAWSYGACVMHPVFYWKKTLRNCATLCSLSASISHGRITIFFNGLQTSSLPTYKVL